ncbi:MAG: hypothetical protein WCE52_12530 [Candidatus Acidiferrum sp.]
MLSRTITFVLEEKVQGAVGRTEHLVSLVPADRLNWRPDPANEEICEVIDLGHLLGHLLDCMAGFCAAFLAAYPKELAEFVKLKSARVNHFCTPREWKERIGIYKEGIAKGFQLCTDEDLKRPIATIFMPKGEVLGSILLNNLEHVLNHKYQLFFYLRLLGVFVGTEDLYDLKKAPR